MNDSSMSCFAQAFLEAFQQVLSQCSGVTWIGETSDASASASPDLLWSNATVSGTINGAFALGFQSGTAIMLAQILTMSEQPSADFGPDEKEAATEFLRQVCGIASSLLDRGSGQPTLSVVGDTPLSTPATTQLLRFNAGERTIEIFLASDLSLQSSFQTGLASTQSATTSGETDHTSLHSALASRNLDLLMNVRLGVRLRFGSRRIKLREILEFHAGSIVELDRQVQEPVDLLVDDKLIARGEVVVVDGNYGLKVLDVASPQQCVDALY